MHRRSILLAATALLAAGRLCASPRQLRRSRRRLRETDKKADPLQPQKAEQEPRPVSRSCRSRRARAAPAHRQRAADPKKWDVSARHGPGHDVPIDTRSGTWMSLDVSPDGREIVFDLLGDIYVMPIGGGEARALATGHAWDMQPRYSPERHRDRLHLGPRRRRQYLGDGPRRLRPARDHQGELPAAQPARLDARRRVRRRAQAFHRHPLARARARCGSTTAPASARACR